MRLRPEIRERLHLTYIRCIVIDFALFPTVYRFKKLTVSGMERGRGDK